MSARLWKRGQQTWKSVEQSQPQHRRGQYWLVLITFLLIQSRRSCDPPEDQSCGDLAACREVNLCQLRGRPWGDCRVCLHDWHRRQTAALWWHHQYDSRSRRWFVCCGWPLQALCVCVCVCVWVCGWQAASIPCGLPAPQKSVHLVLKKTKKKRPAVPDWMTTFRLWILIFFFLLFLFLWSLLFSLLSVSFILVEPLVFAVGSVLLGLIVLLLPLLHSLFWRTVEWRLCSLFPHWVRLTLFSLCAVE